MGGVSGGAGEKTRVEGRDRLLLLFLFLEGALGLLIFRLLDDDVVLVLDPKISDIESS